MQNVLDTLRERGFLAQITFEDELYKQLEKEPTTFYVGFDPTATSLHFGHFIPIIAMAHMQRAGHIPGGRRHGHDRRPLRQNRYAQNDDRGNH